MANVIAEVTTDGLQAFADAWNAHDLDAIMAFMTEDCVFEASAGPDVPSRARSAPLSSRVRGPSPSLHCADCAVTRWLSRCPAALAP
jgi:hypothetical protein